MEKRGPIPAFPCISMHFHELFAWKTREVPGSMARPMSAGSRPDLRLESRDDHNHPGEAVAFAGTTCLHQVRTSLQNLQISLNM